MKNIPLIGVLTALAIAGPVFSCATAAEEEGLALAIVYDTSGSMGDNVRDADGKLAPKYKIANRALEVIARQIQVFAINTAGGAPRKVQAGLFTFEGGGIRPAVPFGPFDVAALQKFARTFASPSSGTPLGNALQTASQTVLNSGLARKHVLVITDGMNTVGPDPASTMPAALRHAEQKKTSLAVHFVAFDVDAKVFAPLKKLGATVVGAADETQLNTQLAFILQKKILLEDEEPPARTKTN